MRIGFFLAHPESVPKASTASPIAAPVKAEVMQDFMEGFPQVEQQPAPLSVFPARSNGEVSCGLKYLPLRSVPHLFTARPQPSDLSRLPDRGTLRFALPGIPMARFPKPDRHI